MEVVTKIITIMGGLVAIGGLGWCFVGAIDFFQGKKNQNPQQTDGLWWRTSCCSIRYCSCNCCCDQRNSILKDI